MDWDDEYDLLAAGGSNAGPSFINRVRNVNDDDLNRAARPAPADPFLQPDEPETPLEQLMRHWTNERHCPDILPAQEDILANLLDHLRRQVRVVQG
jgi:GINS complex subunit 4